MKKALLVFISLILMSTVAAAQEKTGFGVSLGYGQSKDDIDIFRAGLVKDWNVRWLKNSTGYVDGYFELSYNHWKHGSEKVHGVALSPVFKYAFNADEDNWYPYIEGGIGVAYIDEYYINGRDLSSNFQFEDRIGIGYRFDCVDLNFRYLHYSNAGLKEPNAGIDIWLGTIAWFF